MAHIQESAPQAGSSYFEGQRLNDQAESSNTEISGSNAPSRLEGEVVDLKADGSVPSDIDGSSRKDNEGTGVEERPPTLIRGQSEFEVLGLMRTTSYKSQDVVSSRRRSEIDSHISSIPETDHDHEEHDEEPPKRISITGLCLREKLKEKVPALRSSNSGKAEKGHQKHDSANPDPEFEVLGLMRSNTRDGDEDKTPVEEKPSLERHISSIPQEDEHEDTHESGYQLPPKLKRHVSSIPTHDYDSEDEDPVEYDPNPISKVEKHDSGTAGSDFEVHGLMRITSNESGKGKSRSPMKRPGLERHISRIPQHDDDDDEDSLLKSTTLTKTISNIPVHDYDSDGENPVLN